MRADELDSIVDEDLLFDFYGELLTEHQRRIFEKVVFDDCSISEVGRDEGISRQGVSDLIRRTTEQLMAYEKKLRLVARFRKQRRFLKEIVRLSEAGENEQSPAFYGEICTISKQMLDET